MSTLTVILELVDPALRQGAAPQSPCSRTLANGESKTLMKRRFSASIVRDGEWFVAQCLDVDVVSQGKTPEEALANLKEALELYFEPPVATPLPEVYNVEVEIGAA